jgi:hypothetical protein
MTETAESPVKPVAANQIRQLTIDGLKNTKLISPQDKIVSVWQHSEDYGYPTPSLERDQAIKLLQPELMKRKILSRGRFGMWKYEVSNQDHSLMQGVEAANYIVNGDRETTAWYPEIVNGQQPYPEAA